MTAANGVRPGTHRFTWSRRAVGLLAAPLIAAPFLAGLGTQAASAAPVAPTLSAQAILGSPKVAVGAVPRIPAGDRALGAQAASASESAAVVLRPRNQAALTKFVAAVTSKNSTEYHHYLSRGAYASRFGPTSATIGTVRKALAAEGLAVTSVSKDGLLVTVHGTAAQIEHAFGIGLEKYQLKGGGTGQSTIGAPRIPAVIAPSVAAVVGLDNMTRNQPADRLPSGSAMKNGFPAAKAAAVPHVVGAPSACTLAQQDAVTSGGLTDDQIANSYGAFGLYDHGDFGQGQHIAVFELQPFLATDIETFDSCYFGTAEAKLMAGADGNLAGSRLSIVPVDGGELQPGPGSENDEATLDIEDVSAIAPGADIDVYEAPNTSFGSLDQYSAIVNDDVDQVVTSSWLECEQLTQVAEPGVQEAENFLFQQAAAQGQTAFAAAGDTGDDECNSDRDVEPPAGQNFLSVLDPASQPYVVAVGGTTIDNATQPPAEHVWNDGASWGGGGGGISESWQMPSWQQSVAVSANNTADISNAEALETATASESAPYTTQTFCAAGGTPASATFCREVPDVTAQADEFTGSITIYGASLGYGNPNGWTTIGGTSSATPIWAALMALVNASATCQGDTVNGVQDAGFASPLLYGIAASPAAYAASFNDITTGNNDIYGLDNGLVFPARKGYDMASGLGSPQLTSPGGGNGLAFYLCDYAGQFAPPVVASLSRTSGPTAGGYSVTVTGSGFATSGTSDIASVQVGTAKATAISAVTGSGSGQTFSVTVPAASTTTPPGSPNPTQDGAGPAPVIVTLTSGASSLPGPASMFDYVDTSGSSAVPSVTSVSPYGGLEGSSSPATVTIFGAGFAAGATVDFGGVAGTVDKVVSPFEIRATPPAFPSLTPGTACPVDNGSAGQPLSPTGDICQVEVTVTVAGQTSATATILPSYNGPLNYDSMGAAILPVGCGCEDEPQTSEYDYVPAPTVTSVSTTLSDPASLASEYGGAPSNTVVVTGTGMDLMTLSYATLGLPLNENAIDYPIQESGTSMVIEAPFNLPADFTPTVQPTTIPVGFGSIAGQSNTGNIIYSGVPVVTGVANPSGQPAAPEAQACASPPPASGCGTPLTITGTGFNQVTGPIGYVDNFTGTSLGTQYNYTVNSDSSISTQSLQQNPDVVDVEVCSTTGCNYSPPGDLLYIYPPGNPKISTISPSHGPAQGGNEVVIDGTNLGCAVGVSFGKVGTDDLSNAEALLDCGQTGEVDVIAPPGKAGTTVRVRIETVESFFTGSHSNSVTYRYTKSAPSAPASLAVSPGKASATVKWSAPASDGGDAVTGYIVSARSKGREGAHVTLSSHARSHKFAFLQPGVKWTFSVAAVSGRGDGLTDTSRAYTLAPGDNGYLVATAGGGTYGFGSLSSSGGPGGGTLPSLIAGIAPTPDGLGYFEVAANGHVYHFGNAGYYGDATVKSGQRVVGIAAAPSGRGYWVLLNTGAVQAFGHVTHYGSVHGVTDAVGIAVTPDGDGYYVVQSDGAVARFGDATVKGSASGHDIAGIAVDPAAAGFWLVGTNGAVYAFGHAGKFGHPDASAAGIAGTPDGKGYWVLAPDGNVFHFGKAQNAGNAVGTALSRAVGIVTA
jgi:hypothetical protein